MADCVQSLADLSSQHYVTCPLCPWRCRHHGKRSDGLPVSWRVPADEAYSGNSHDRAFVKAFAYMRAHIKGHERDLTESFVETARVKLAMAFIPCRHKKVQGSTDEERKNERKKRYRSKQIEYCRRRRKIAREERREAKFRQVPQLSLREDLEQRGFNPQASTQPRRDEGEIIDLYIADQPTQRSFEDRCGEAGMERSDLREFVARAEPLVFASGGDTKALSNAVEQLSKFYDLGKGVGLHALKKAVSCANKIISAWEREGRTSAWTNPSEPVLSWPQAVDSEEERRKAWQAHNKYLGKASNASQGDCGHHLTYKSQNNVIEALTRRRRGRRRVLEYGYGTGYLTAGLAAFGLDVFGIELKQNAGTVSRMLRKAENVVLCEMDGRGFTARLLDEGRFTSLTCIVGLHDVTKHVAGIFLDSWYCTELAYLLPAQGARDVRTMLEERNVALEQFQVTLSGGNGKRSVVIATKREIASFA